MMEAEEYFVDLRVYVGSPQMKETYREAHRAYLRELRRQGKLLMAGPFTDGSGGFAVFTVGSQEEASTLSQKDPFVANGVQRSNIKCWQIKVR